MSIEPQKNVLMTRPTPPPTIPSNGFLKDSKKCKRKRSKYYANDSPTFV